MDSVIATPPLPPCPAPFNLAQYVLFAAAAANDKPALVLAGPEQDQTLSYGDLRSRVAGLAAALQQRGLQPGARVLIRLGNTPAFPLVFLAALWAGLVPVPTSAALTVPEITALAAQLGPDLIVAGAGIALPDGATPVIPEDALDALYPTPAKAPALGDPNRPGYIVFTSGTSGLPRGVIHAHRAVWARQMMGPGWTDLRASDRLLHAGAFNWTYTLGTGLLDPWSVGATAIVPASGTTSTDLPALLARCRATIFAAAPGVYRQMLRVPLPPLPALRHGLSAGEKLAPNLANLWHETTGTLVHEAFGMSEISTFLSGAPARAAPPGTSGYAQPGRHIALLDAQGAPVPMGHEGTIAVHKTDPGLMLGYLNADTETQDRYKGAWFLTGDMGSMDATGAVTYLGRQDDMLNAGGIRVSPLEIEAALNSHPQVLEAAAIEQRISDDTSIIAAFYTAAHPLPSDSLRAFLADRLAAYKLPRSFTHVQSLPKSGNGKLNRKALRS